MKTLLVLRHAKSSWKDDAAYDHDRPLNPRGRRTAPLVGEELLRRNLVPDQILSSTAKRARQTVTKAVATCGFEGDLHYHERLYAGSPAECLDVLREVAVGNRVLLVGHNPGLEELVEQLTGQKVAMRTAGCAVIELDLDEWSGLSSTTSARLVEVFRPEDPGA